MLAHRMVVDGDRVSDSIERALLIVLYALPKVNRNGNPIVSTNHPKPPRGTGKQLAACVVGRTPANNKLTTFDGHCL
ncbi:hypothetical protein OUZ56_003216 [Daphnia magna]|uniref:Uncharacterized protein n=1 Tax=Daphnia magna TaxID=35525 RepID=A0ABR0A826_9CRUS|nr:hypothetical protein OUZ56_003216 [Daphnia magna]